jgi:thioredoxin-like negative regulator of GroEL
LKGNWFEAERGLYRLLRENDHDLEARLLLATLFRHTKRFEEATRQLNQLARLDGAQRWALEIQREGQLLAEARRDTITAEDNAAVAYDAERAATASGNAEIVKESGELVPVGAGETETFSRHHDSETTVKLKNQEADLAHAGQESKGEF